MLTTIETELTHAHNMLHVAELQLEQAIESGNINELDKIWSLIIKADDNIREQLSNIIELNLKPVK